VSESHLLLLLISIALFVLFSGPISRGSLTPPMVFILLGLVSSLIGFGWIALSVDTRVVHVIAEVTLILVLFTDAAKIKGLASILFVLLVLDHAHLTHESLVFNTVIVTVALSVFLHGVTALPGVKAYTAALKVCTRRGDDEQQTVAAMPLPLPPSHGLGKSNDDG